ncbi:MAG TPA: hypothetical protein VK581_13345 [Chthoniobacterales bacterium]|nr:hypothetical protein [Chthoniobacterales bacterium]
MTKDFLPGTNVQYRTGRAHSLGQRCDQISRVIFRNFLIETISAESVEE